MRTEDMAAEPTIPAVAYPCLARGHETQTAFSLPDHKLHQLSMPELSGNAFLVTPQGWILVLVIGNSSGSPSSPSTSRETYLLHPQSKSRVDLPVLDDDDELPERASRCLLSVNDPTAPGCGVLVLDGRSPAMWSCRVTGRPRWSKHTYDIGCFDLPEEYCPVPKRRNIFDVAAVAGSFFFFESDSNTELGTLDFFTAGDGAGDPPVFARLGAIPVPSLDDELYGDRQRSCVVATYLLESGGGLYLATVTFYDFCFDPPAGKARVYRMDFSAPAFRETHDIGGRAFLLGRSNFAASCSASEHGLKANCLYWLNCFSEEDAGSVHVYDVKDGGLLETIQTFGSTSSAGHKPFWILPPAAAT